MLTAVAAPLLIAAAQLSGAAAASVLSTAAPAATPAKQFVMHMAEAGDGFVWHYTKAMYPNGCMEVNQTTIVGWNVFKVDGVELRLPVTTDETRVTCPADTIAHG